MCLMTQRVHKSCRVKMLDPFRRFDLEHSNDRADGDVVAEQADGFDKLCAAEFALHPRE